MHSLPLRPKRSALLIELPPVKGPSGIRTLSSGVAIRCLAIRPTDLVGRMEEDLHPNPLRVSIALATRPGPRPVHHPYLPARIRTEDIRGNSALLWLLSYG